MVTTLCSSSAVVLKAGANAGDIPNVGDVGYTQLINQAEAVICMNGMTNWIDTYATLNSDVKQILEEVTSNIAAQYVIMYDMSGFTTRYEAETMLDVLNNGVLRGMALLREAKRKDFINGA